VLIVGVTLIGSLAVDTDTDKKSSNPDTIVEEMRAPSPKTQRDGYSEEFKARFKKTFIEECMGGDPTARRVCECGYEFLLNRWGMDGLISEGQKMAKDPNYIPSAIDDAAEACKRYGVQQKYLN
jgi:hypothetical protein